MREAEGRLHAQMSALEAENSELKRWAWHQQRTRPHRACAVPVLQTCPITDHSRFSLPKLTNVASKENILCWIHVCVSGPLLAAQLAPHSCMENTRRC